VNLAERLENPDVLSRYGGTARRERGGEKGEDQAA
jgi:hypothetical protein